MRAQIARLTDGLGGFFGWWLGELSALVPHRLSQLLFPPPRFLLLAPAEGSLTLWDLRGNRASRLKTVDLTESSGIGVRDQLQQQVRRVDIRNALTVLRMPASRGLRCRLVLPAAAEQDLRGALELQVDRQTPFTTEAAVFDYRILARNRQSGMIDVEMAVAPRQAVEEVRERCRAWGLDPDIIDLAPDHAGDATEERGDGPGETSAKGQAGGQRGGPEFNLIGEAAPPPRSRPWRAVNLALGLAAIVLLAAAAYLPIHREQVRAAHLAARVAVAKTAADQAMRLRDRIDARHTDAKFFSDLKDARPPVVLVLDELTRTLPDDTWLRRFSLSGREVQVTGYAPTASTLVGLIDESELFETPRFLSTVTSEPATGLESFKFSFALEDGEAGSAQ